MYKVFIIGNDKNIFKSIKNIFYQNIMRQVDIKTLGYKQSISRDIVAFKPDIIFIDITDNEKLGIDTLRTMCNWTHGASIIAMIEDINGYAGLATNLGVSACINKPIDCDEAVSVLRRIVNKVNLHRKNEEKQRAIQSKFDNMIPILENHFIDDLLFHTYYPASMEKMKDVLGIHSNLGYFALLHFLQGGKRKSKDSSISYILHDNYNEIRELIKKQIDGFPGGMIKEGIPLYIGTESAYLDEYEKNILISQMKTLMYILEERYGISFQVGIGSVYHMEQVSCSYQEALEALEKTEKQIVFYEDLSSESSIRKALQYIQSNFTENISLNDIAEELEISTYYLSRLFKSKTGMNYIDYLTDIRLTYAKHLLIETNESIQNVCITSGYMDPNYFSRIFKKRVGVTPREYKERYQKRI